jgi:hypothetical protein
MRRTVPPEFRQQLTVPGKQPIVPEPVAALEAFATEMKRELGDNPLLYQVNRARLALADRHELLRRATPIRSRGILDDSFNRHFAELFDTSLKLQHAQLEPPPVAQPPVEPKPRPRSAVDALMEAFS